MTEDTTIRLQVTVTKNPGRKSGYTASYGPWQSTIEAEGSTAAEAKANLTVKLVTALQAIRGTEPGIARADDGALHVAVPDFDGGSRWYRVTDDAARLTTFASTPAPEAFAACIGMTVLPVR